MTRPDHGDHDRDKIRVEGSINLDFSPQALLCAIGEVSLKLEAGEAHFKAIRRDLEEIKGRLQALEMGPADAEKFANEQVAKLEALRTRIEGMAHAAPPAPNPS